MKLCIVIASTRPGRVGLPIARWFENRARAHGKFEIEVADLAEVNLPLLDEPKHPRLMQYEHEHTKAWSKTVASADAFAFVTPEYDYSMPATLLNALQYLFVEWHYKAVGLASYGGISGGLRSQQMAKLIITSLRMMPIPESVTITSCVKHLENGVFKGEKPHEDSVVTMLDELARWTSALAPMRAAKK